jgi:hypothetical protein
MDGIQNTFYKIIMKTNSTHVEIDAIKKNSINQCKYGFPSNAQLYQQCKFNYINY